MQTLNLITDRDQVQSCLGSYKQCVPTLCLICLCIILTSVLQVLNILIDILVLHETEIWK